jgi:hypothetical protein
LLVLFNLFGVELSILPRKMDNTEFGVISELAELPFLVTLRIVQKGLLLQSLERLILENLSESELVRLKLHGTRLQISSCIFCIFFVATA